MLPMSNVSAIVELHDISTIEIHLAAAFDSMVQKDMVAIWCAEIEVPNKSRMGDLQPFIDDEQSEEYRSWNPSSHKTRIMMMPSLA